jgi:triphosphatase
MEIELKLALDDRHAARLRRHPLLAGAKASRRHLHSVYFDTPDFALMRRSIAFRLRRVGYHWVQTLKAESRAVGALSSRPEWEIPVAGSTPDFAVMPPEALDLLAGIDLARVGPVFSTEFQRTTWELATAGAVAELALDRGSIRAGEASQPLSELEIELKSGPPEALFDWARQLLADLPLRVEPRSKAERGYVLCEASAPAPVGAGSPRIRPGQPAPAAWVEVVRSGLTQLVANVPGFLEHPEDIEYLHQLRVALRRLRGAAGLYRSLGLERPLWSAELGDIMDRLNPARDWDVFLHETLPAVRDALAGAPLGEDLPARARHAAQQARLAAQAAVASPAFTRLVLDIGQSLHAGTAEGIPADAWAARILDKRWKRMRGLARNLGELDPAARHRLRIAAKKLRYAADALAGLYGKRARPFIKRLAILQDGLGRANDAFVATRLLEDFRRRDRDLAYDAGRVCGVMIQRASHRGREDAAAWRRLLGTPPFWR